MANPNNLIPQAHKLTVEEASKGGIASGKKRAKNAKLKELFRLYGSMPDPDCEGRTNNESMVVNQYRLAKSDKPGSTQAAIFIRDTSGEKPHDVLETPNIEMKPLVDLTKRAKNGSDDKSE